jgi:hypothetical protein
MSSTIDGFAQHQRVEPSRHARSRRSDPIARARVRQALSVVMDLARIADASRDFFELIGELR